MATKCTKGKPKTVRKPAVIVSDAEHLKRVGPLKLEHWRMRFEDGDRKALFGALKCCATHDIPMPQWVSSAFIIGYDKVVNGEVTSWDDAFGAPHPKGVHISRARNSLKMFAVQEEVAEEVRRGSSINRELFERVGRKLGLGKTRVEELYYRLRQITEMVKNQADLIRARQSEALPRKDHSPDPLSLEPGTSLGEGFHPGKK